MPNPVPLLFTYIFGEAALAAYQGASERLLLWAAALEGWLEELSRTHKTDWLRQGKQAWRRLLRQAHKMPWELSRADIEQHVAWLKAEGYAPYTVYHAVGHLASFYRWCSEQGVDPECAQDYNPAAGVSNPWPRPYEGVKLLSRGEAQALLETLRRDESPQGKRDYAFILARLRLGVPLRHLQHLKWEQVEHTEGGTWVRWREGAEGVRLADEVWEAIRRYLAAAGRLAGMQPFMYIFAPLGEPTREERGDQAGDWRENQALTGRQLRYNLKRYGRLAQVEEEKLTLEGLRLTAVRMKLDEGWSLEEIRLFLDSRDDLKNIKYRLGDLPALPAEAQKKEAGSQGGGVLAHKAHIYKEGEGVKHGWYVKSQPPQLIQEVLAENIQGIEEEIAGMRLLERGLFERQVQASSTQAALRLGDAYSLTGIRLAEMLKTEEGMPQGKQGGKEKAAKIEGVLDWLVRTEGEAGRPTNREAVRADLLAQALGGGAVLELTAHRLEEEIAGVRFNLRNTLFLAMQAETEEEYIHLVELYSRGCSRLVRMLRTGQGGQGGQDRLFNYIQEQILLAIEATAKDWNLSV